MPNDGWLWALSDVYSGDDCEEEVPQQRSHQPSAQHQERTAQQRRHDDDDVCCRWLDDFSTESTFLIVQHEHVSVNQRQQSLQSSSSLTNKATVRARSNQHFMRQDTGEHNSKSGEINIYTLLIRKPNTAITKNRGNIPQTQLFTVHEIICNMYVIISLELLVLSHVSILYW